MKKAVIVLADGFETVEALAPVDILRRGGVEVTMASITQDRIVTSSHKVRMETDALLSELNVLEYDAIILPGGMPGTIHLGESELVKEALLAMNEAGKLLAAICAAPGVLGKYGILTGKNACSYPEHEANLTGANVLRDAVVVDGNIVTSRGMGTTLKFSFKLLEILMSRERAEEVKGAIIYY